MFKVVSMKDKYGRKFTDYTCIPRRLLAYMADKRYPIKPKHILLYDLLWNTVDADWDKMVSGKPIPRAVLRERLKLDNKDLDAMLRDLENLGFIERIKKKERDPNVQVNFLVEPK